MNPNGDESEKVTNNTNNTNMESNKKTSQEITQQISGGKLQLSVPLTITVELGQPSPITSGTQFLKSVSSIEGAEAIRKFVPDPNYKNRKGYNVSFLGRKVLLPKLTTEQKNQQLKIIRLSQAMTSMN
jgi:hypothetical protein